MAYSPWHVSQKVLLEQEPHLLQIHDAFLCWWWMSGSVWKLFTCPSLQLKLLVRLIKITKRCSHTSINWPWKINIQLIVVICNYAYINNPEITYPSIVNPCSKEQFQSVWHVGFPMCSFFLLLSFFPSWRKDNLSWYNEQRLKLKITTKVETEIKENNNSTKDSTIQYKQKISH